MAKKAVSTFSQNMVGDIYYTYFIWTWQLQ